MLLKIIILFYLNKKKELIYNYKKYFIYKKNIKLYNINFNFK